MNDDFYNKMIELSKKIDISLTETQIKKFFEYMQLLLEWNEKINLTAITEVDDIILKHFIDSLTVIKCIKENDKIIDVGTGAGFPGIPVGIINLDADITLLDSLNKRINFLNEVCNKLELKNIKTIHGRAEDFGQNKETREKFDIAISRAVANMTTLVEYLLPFVKVGGYAICMKGPEIDEELSKSKFAIKELGGQVEKVGNFVLPNADIERNIVIIKKISDTPNKYPRKAGTPSQSPMFHR